MRSQGITNQMHRTELTGLSYAPTGLNTCDKHHRDVCSVKTFEKKKTEKNTHSHAIQSSLVSNLSSSFITVL